MQSWLPTALLSIAIGAIGQFLLKLASRSFTSLPLLGPGAPAALVRLVANPYLLAGLVCFGMSMLLWVKVLSAAPLNTAYPLVSLGYLLVAALSWALLGERLALRQVVALAVIVFGVAMLGSRGTR